MVKVKVICIRCGRRLAPVEAPRSLDGNVIWTICDECKHRYMQEAMRSGA
jgi:hypothetical protein